MQLPKVVEVRGIRVLTSKQLAEEYGASTQKIKQNFANNRKRFVEGKHYISFTGDDLRNFKNQVENIDLVDGRTSHLYLLDRKRSSSPCKVHKYRQSLGGIRLPGRFLLQGE